MNTNKKFNKLVKHYSKAIHEYKGYYWDWDGDEGSCNYDSSVDYSEVLGEETIVAFNLKGSALSSYDAGDYWTAPSSEILREDFDIEVTDVYYCGEKVELTIGQLRRLETIIHASIEVE